MGDFDDFDLSTFDGSAPYTPSHHRNDSINPSDNVGKRPTSVNAESKVRRLRPTNGAPIRLNPKAPYQNAKTYIDLAHMMEGLRTIHYHMGGFYTWNGAVYRADADGDDGTRARLYEWLDRCVVASKDADGKLQDAPFHPTQTKVNTLIDALKALVRIDAETPIPAWIGEAPGCEHPLSECIVARNGIVHLPTGQMFPPTPALFATSAMPVAYDPFAPEPTTWLNFLKDVWPDNPEAIQALQEMFGYCLTPDTSQQKMFFLVGPPRSGKGTIARVLTALIGKENVAGPTLSSLQSNFGLAPLIGKQVAIISDARLSGKADQGIIAERLLSISGEDTQTIDRKNRSAWTGKLSSRVILLSNEVPQIADASGAMTSRFILMQMERSFYGQEDTGLGGKLMAELPGILQWAADGFLRLHERGKFVQPANAAEELLDMEELGSPAKAFARDCCMTSKECRENKMALYGAFKLWCEARGIKPTAAPAFFKNLKAAVPGLKDARPRQGDDDGRRPREYIGIALRHDAL